LAQQAKKKTATVRGLIRDAALARLAAGDVEGYGATLGRLLPRQGTTNPPARSR
jgi:hypothetical protein